MAETRLCLYLLVVLFTIVKLPSYGQRMLYAYPEKSTGLWGLAYSSDSNLAHGPFIAKPIYNEILQASDNESDIGKIWYAGCLSSNCNYRDSLKEYHILDYSGNIICAVIAQEVFVDWFPLIGYMKNRKFGVISPAGKPIVAPIYDVLCPQFSYGNQSDAGLHYIGKVQKRETSCYVLLDKSGRVVLDEGHTHLSFSCLKDRLLARKNGRSGWIDFDGVEKITLRFDSSIDFNSKSKNQKKQYASVGLLNKKGKLLLGGHRYER